MHGHARHNPLPPAELPTALARAETTGANGANLQPSSQALTGPPWATAATRCGRADRTDVLTRVRMIYIQSTANERLSGPPEGAPCERDHFGRDHHRTPDTGDSKLRKMSSLRHRLGRLHGSRGWVVGSTSGAPPHRQMAPRSDLPPLAACVSPVLTGHGSPQAAAKRLQSISTTGKGNSCQDARGAVTGWRVGGRRRAGTCCCCGGRSGQASRGRISCQQWGTPGNSACVLERPQHPAGCFIPCAAMGALRGAEAAPAMPDHGRDLQTLIVFGAATCTLAGRIAPGASPANHAVISGPHEID